MVDNQQAAARQYMMADNRQPAASQHIITGNQQVATRHHVMTNHRQAATRPHVMVYNRQAAARQSVMAGNRPVATRQHAMTGNQQAAAKQHAVAGNRQAATRPHIMADYRNIAARQRIMADDRQAAARQCVRRCRVDYLNIRLRRMVQAILKDEKKETDSDAFQYLRDKQQTFIRRLLSLIAILICSGLFIYQTNNQIKFYFEYPITTDVFIKIQKYQTFPEITICFFQTEYLMKICRKYGYQQAYFSTAMQIPLTIEDKLTLAELWEEMKTSKVITSAKKIGRSSHNLTYSDIVLPRGTCTTFLIDPETLFNTDHDKIEVTFPTTNKECGVHAEAPAYVHEIGEDPIFRSAHQLLPLMKNDIRIEIRKFSFVNRTKDPCVSYDDYRKCKYDCFTDFSLGFAACRYPFLPKLGNLTECNPSMHKYVNFLYLKVFFEGSSDLRLCECTRKCEHSVFEEKITTAHLINQTIYTLGFDGPYTTEIRQRLVYDQINLFADIGGSSGLFIGFSILSLVQLLTSCQLRKKSSRFTPADPLYSIVTKTFRKYKKMSNVITITNNCNSVSKIVLFTICLSLLLLAVAYRITYFLQRPAQNVVEISFVTTLHHPTVTICGGNPVVRKLQEEYAMKNNISDSCDVDFWHLLSLPHINAKTLWTVWTPDHPFNFWREFKVVNLYDGVCFSINLDLIPKPALMYGSINAPLLPICGTSYIKVYLRPPTGYYDLFLYRYIVLNYLQQFSYTMKEIVTDNNVEPCVKEEDHEFCKFACRGRKLHQRIDCWLPYMPVERFPMCNSSSSAKHAHLTYIEIFSVESIDDCNCPPPCRKRFYETMIMATEWQNYHAFRLGARHNMIESYMKRPSYSFVALLCDIGGFLGTTLGMCVLDVMEVMLSSRVFTKPKMINDDKWKRF